MFEVIGLLMSLTESTLLLWLLSRQYPETHGFSSAAVRLSAGPAHLQSSLEFESSFPWILCFPFLSPRRQELWKMTSSLCTIEQDTAYLSVQFLSAKRAN